MRNVVAVFAGTIVTATALAAAPGSDIDMAAVQKWSKVKSVHYHVDGVYSDWTSMSPKWTSGQGEATDSLKLDFDWSIRERKLIGRVTFTNGASSVKGTRSTAKECPAPTLAGAYEHFDAKTAAQDFDARIVVKGTRIYAAVNAPLECPASLKLMPTPGSSVETTEYIPVPEPMMLAVGETGNPNITISKDKKTFVVRANGWTWTYTPTIID